MGIVMKYAVNDSQVKRAQALYAQSQVKRLRRIYFRLLLALIVSAILIVLYHFQWIEIEVNAVFSIYEIPALWLFCIGVQFVLYYADRIPVLRNWQRKLLEKTLEKERHSFENQFYNSH
ncbi:hypothetical protein [Flavobacterium sp. JP2137]|uniref:hypothetical protein n=1 Tax=Flavobacterium sp. JP2137 TaxID=3414510 RepID=UPI003D2FF921